MKKIGQKNLSIFWLGFFGLAETPPPFLTEGKKQFLCLPLVAQLDYQLVGSGDLI